MEVKFTHNGLKHYYLDGKLIKTLDKQGRIHYYRENGTVRKIVNTLSEK